MVLKTKAYVGSLMLNISQASEKKHEIHKEWWDCEGPWKDFCKTRNNVTNDL